MGFFSKKKEEPKTPHPAFLKLVKKWDDFLTKIETRFTESLVNAEEALLENLVESDYDINPTLGAWRGIKAQLDGLAGKVSDTYDNAVKPKMLNYIEPWEILEQNQKGVKLEESILRRVKRFEIILEGKISKRFYDHAILFLNKDFNCTQCSAKIEVKKDIFRSHYVSCDYCNTVNTFTPNDKIAQIRWIVDNIAKHNALAERDLMKEAKQEYKALRSWSEGEDMTKHKAALKKREETERAFWQKYFTERFHLLPEHKETFEHDVDVKMRWFYEERKRELNF